MGEGVFSLITMGIPYKYQKQPKRNFMSSLTTLFHCTCYQWLVTRSRKYLCTLSMESDENGAITVYPWWCVDNVKAFLLQIQEHLHANTFKGNKTVEVFYNSLWLKKSLELRTIESVPSHFYYRARDKNCWLVHWMLYGGTVLIFRKPMTGSASCTSYACPGLMPWGEGGN